VAKLRLAVENLPVFLSLQMYAKEADAASKGAPDKEIKREVD
jgi:hypothetical protein